jgi:hypothetical protein
MKTKITAFFVALTVQVFAQIQYIDVVTPHTNTVISAAKITINGSITITGYATNAPFTFTSANYWTTNTSNIYTGDTAATAYTKSNTNFYSLNSAVANSTNLALILVSNYTALVSNLNYQITNANLTGTFNATGGNVMTNRQLVAWLGNLTLTNLSDTTGSMGAAGQVPVADGSGNWGWAAVIMSGGLMNFDSGLITSDGSGNVTAATVKSGLTDSAFSTGTFGYMPVAMGDGTWTWMAGVTITNTITMYNFTNALLSSRQILVYQTNNIVWGTSNYLARCSNGLQAYNVSFGTLGGDSLLPGTNVNGHLVGSYTGTSSWFTLTNGFFTTNAISISAVGAGGGLGFAALYTVDHFELLGRTNYLYGQYTRFDAPRDPNDAATKNYVDTAVANIKDGAFTTWTTNGTTHFAFQRNLTTIFDMMATASYVPITGISLDGTGTNALMTCYATNLPSGFTVQSSTNLLLLSSWTAWTNYSTNISAGVVTFTLPLDFNEPQRFWRIQATGSTAAAFYSPLTVAAGTFWPSNSWNLAAITNGMANFGFWTGNSNGQALVSLYLSNGVVRIKQLAP